VTSRPGNPAAAVLSLLAVVGCSSIAPSALTSPQASSPGSSAQATGAPPTRGPTASAGLSATLPTKATWRRLPVDGPAPRAREDHTWTLDGDGRTAYLFGGRDGETVFDDLWTFDLVTATWRRIAVTGGAPSARFGHEAAWLPGRGLAVFAGQSGGEFFNDLWILDPVTTRWQLQPDGGDVPAPRYGSCSGIGPDGRLWISHGFTEDGVRFADTKSYDVDAGRWEDQAPAGDGPIQRCLHACWWTTDGRFALYGGQTTGVPALGDMWLLTPGSGGSQTNAWSELRDPGPPARQLPAVAQLGPITFLFGGRDLDRRPLEDLWVRLDGTASAFIEMEAAGEGPASRSGASLIADRGRNRLLLFGGLGDDAFADLWELDPEP
jgi:galactose oxidase-like protein